MFSQMKVNTFAFSCCNEQITIQESDKRRRWWNTSYLIFFFLIHGFSEWDLTQYPFVVLFMCFSKMLLAASLCSSCLWYGID